LRAKPANRRRLPQRTKNYVATAALRPKRFGAQTATAASDHPKGHAMNLYHPQFAPSLDVPDAPATRRTLIIASTPRSGSHMLGHALAATGRMGVPYEYCHQANLAEWQKRLHCDDLRSTLQAIMRRRTTPNGIFAIKAHYSQAGILGGAEALLSAFPDPHIVHIRRADVLRQAISFSIAMQTGVWIDEQEPVSATVRYDARAITTCLRDIATQNACWTTALRASGLPTMTLEYDAVCDDLPATLRRVAAFLEIDLPRDVLPATAPTRPQAVTGRTEQWIARFAAPRGGGVLDRLRRTAADRA
jgi:trehalose 2-sulfotransferase